MSKLETIVPRAIAACGGTGRELARRIGVNETAVSDWRRGKVAPSLRSLLKMAAITGDDAELISIEHQKLLRAEAAIPAQIGA